MITKHIDKILKTPEHHLALGSHIKSAVYGGLDGTITTFALVAGVAGASLGAGIVLILGFANLIADGISMAVGDYLSTKSQQEYQRSERKREESEVETVPETEKKEMIDIYISKGMTESDAKEMASILSKHKKAWVDVMMVEELKILEDNTSPLKNAFVTFASFIVFGLMPLLAYLISLIFHLQFNLFAAAIILTGITLFLLGSIKTKITGKNWFTSGMEMLLLGAIAAIAAYIVGYALHGLA